MPKPRTLLQGHEGEAYVRELVRETARVYDGAALELQRAISREGATAFQKYRAAELLRQVKAARRALDGAARSFAESAIPVAYRHGEDIAARQLAIMGITPNPGMGNRLATASVQALTDATALDLLTANGTIEANVSRVIRATQQTVLRESTINRTLAGAVARGETRRTTSKAITRQIEAVLGDGQLITAGSRRFTPKYYAELVTRTRTREAVTEGSINSGLAVGLDLVQVSIHDHPCDYCTPFQGRVFSISGKSEAFPPLTDRPPYHPHCKHVLVPVSEGHLHRRGEHEALRQLSNDPKIEVMGATDYKNALENMGPPRPPTALVRRGSRDDVEAWIRAHRMTDEAAAGVREQWALTVEVARIEHSIRGAATFGKRIAPVEDARRLGGSTGAKLYADDEGTQWVVKTYGGNADQVKNEWLANKLYDTNGLKIAEARLAELESGDLAVAFRMIDGQGVTIARDAGLDTIKAANAFRRGFVTDAYLANWDAVGLEYDNILAVPGSKSKIWRIDQGGSLKYRAQGTPKGSAFGEVVGELDSLRDASLNPSAARMFADVTDDDLIKWIGGLTKTIKPAVIDAAIAEAGYTGAEAAELSRILKARLQWLKSKRATLLFQKEQREAVAAARLAPQGSGVLPKGKPGERRVHAHVVDAEKLSDAELFGAARLKPDQYDAMRRYTGSSYSSMNRAALADRGNEALDKLLDGEDLPGWRGLSARGLQNGSPKGREQFEKWKTGEWAQVEWKAYSSTTIDYNQAWGGNELYVLLNRGMQGSYVNPVSANRGELELLMGRNSAFRVVGWDEKNGKRIVFMEETDTAIPASQVAPPHIDSDRLVTFWKMKYSRGESTANIDIANFER